VPLDLAVAVWDRTEGAEKAYADIRDKVGDAPWMHEVAFVEHHRRDRIVIRGTVQGHYVDTEDESDPMGKDVAVGAITGAVVGAAFGPPGFAAGIAFGGATGGLVEGHHVEELHGDFFDEVRDDVPEGHSALVLLAAADHVDGLVQAADDAGANVVRRTLTDDAVAKFAQSISETPPAGTTPQTGEYPDE
jgi:uncharacterized membrane protein